MKKVLIMIMSGILTTILTLSVLLIMNNISTNVKESLTEVTEEVLIDEIEILLSGNNTVSEFKNMQETLRDMNERLESIFK